MEGAANRLARAPSGAARHLPSGEAVSRLVKVELGGALGAFLL